LNEVLIIISALNDFKWKPENHVVRWCVYCENDMSGSHDQRQYSCTMTDIQARLCAKALDTVSQSTSCEEWVSLISIFKCLCHYWSLCQFVSIEQSFSVVTDRRSCHQVSDAHTAVFIQNGRNSPRNSWKVQIRLPN